MSAFNGAGQLMRPRCHNRPPAAPGMWCQVGRRADGRPVVRWFPRWFEDRCATWDGRGIGPAGEAYPAAHGWSCSGCRWLKTAGPNVDWTQQFIAANRHAVLIESLNH